MSSLGAIIPVYQYCSEEPVWRYFYTTNPNAQQGWKLQGIAFYTFADGVRGAASEVVRYTAANPQRYLYSLKGERVFPRAIPGWQVDGVVGKGVDAEFYAFEKPDMMPEFPLRPVYQFVASNPQRYVYSLSSTPPGSGWTLEGDPALLVSPGGIVFYVLNADIPTAVF